MALLLSPPIVSFVSPSAPRSRPISAVANVSFSALPAAIPAANRWFKVYERFDCALVAPRAFLRVCDPAGSSPLNVTATCASFAEKRSAPVHATAEGSEAGAAEQPEEPKPATKIEEMPLESKQKMIMEQRARMKLAKKLRQRRKRLVRKRKLRKKGRWPPSKMKKLKNV
ncbi:50S ribosomal protein L40 [Zea mays]|uniref:50S ribosomal protein L40 n=1 Tax=Zea mays TaxID=4577 RepID=A0A1D6MQY3_MAIZE|nr:50S ribosomal protein L40 [Zea mays]